MTPGPDHRSHSLSPIWGARTKPGADATAWLSTAAVAEMRTEIRMIGNTGKSVGGTAGQAGLDRALT